MGWTKNKHITISFLVAPILAIISYFAVDAMVAETPHKAKQGGQYQLVSKPSCRYTSGHCQLKNGDFEITITPLHSTNEDNNQLTLKIDSVHPIDHLATGIYLTIQDKTIHKSAVKMDSNWILTLTDQEQKNSAIRLVAQLNDTQYYGEFSLDFVDYQTIFNKDFREQ